MINRFMRLLVFYDLPVVTDKDKKIYTNFRKFLLDDGFYMMQYSIYVRICKNADDVNKHILRLQNHIPIKGNVRLLQVTDKQYQNMKIFCGALTNEDQINSEPLLIFE